MRIHFFGEPGINLRKIAMQKSRRIMRVHNRGDDTKKVSRHECHAMVIKVDLCDKCIIVWGKAKVRRRCKPDCNGV